MSDTFSDNNICIYKSKVVIFPLICTKFLEKIIFRSLLIAQFPYKKMSNQSVTFKQIDKSQILQSRLCSTYPDNRALT